MSLEMKALLVMAPICLVAMAYALTQGNWESAVLFAWIEVLTLMNYRAGKAKPITEGARAPKRDVAASVCQ
jgi:uncharacterized membrane protein